MDSAAVLSSKSVIGLIYLLPYYVASFPMVHQTNLNVIPKIPAIVLTHSFVELNQPMQFVRCCLEFIVTLGVLLSRGVMDAYHRTVVGPRPSHVTSVIPVLLQSS